MVNDEQIFKNSHFIIQCKIENVAFFECYILDDFK